MNITQSMKESRNRSNRKAIEKRKANLEADIKAGKCPKRLNRMRQDLLKEAKRYSATTPKPKRAYKRPNALSKKRVYKPTGELAIFKQIYEELGGVCQITGETIPFNVSNFAHVLSKGSYPRMRLYSENIIHCKPEIHKLYDCNSKEQLLSLYPKATIFFTKKQELKTLYNKRNLVMFQFSDLH